jgi:hypothetical protein
MSLNRRQFLAGLVVLGSPIALSVPVNRASPAEIDAAWKRLLEEPRIFEVDEYGTIRDPGCPEPETWRQLYPDVQTVSMATADDMAQEVDRCIPLAWHLDRLAIERRAGIAQQLSASSTMTKRERRRLQRLLDAGEAQAWHSWISAASDDELAQLRQEIDRWLDQDIDWSMSEWFPYDYGSIGAAKQFFDHFPFSVHEELGVVIVEGDHPCSTYFAAELSVDIDDGNARAEALGMPIRFRCAR